MRRLLLLTLASLGCSRADPPAPPPSSTAREPAPRVSVPPATPGEPMTLLPGRALGPVVLGMPVRELSNHGTLSERSRAREKVHYSLMPWHIGLSARGGGIDGLRLNIAEYPPGVRVGTTLVQATTPLVTLLSALTGCGAPEIQPGGTSTVCEEGRVVVRQEGPARALVIEMSIP